MIKLKIEEKGSKMYKKEDWFILILIGFFACSLATTIAITLNTIEPGNLSIAEIIFSAAGSNSSLYFEVPKNATIFSAKMNVTGYEYDTGYGGQCPTNPSVDIGNDGDSDWNYTGEYCITNRTDDFLLEVRDFLDYCDDEDGYCNVTINVSSESAGIIGLDDIDIEYTDNPKIILLSPFHNKIDLDGNITFVYNVTVGVDNCSLVFDGAINQTDSTINSSFIQYFSLTGAVNSDHLWKIRCMNSSNDEINSETRRIKVLIDTTAPNVTLNGPADNSQDSDGSVELNFSVSDNGWITNCSLYTDMNGTWMIEQTNTFVQKDVPLYFRVEDISNSLTFKWNVVCYDFALNSNFDWGDSNWTLTINNTAPSYSTIPAQQWNEDTEHTINLSSYFSDADGDNLTYSSTSPSNISVSINNETGIVTLNPDINWNGSRTIVFYAFDIFQNVSSNAVTLTVNSVGDNAPRIDYASPVDNANDTDGYVLFNCSGFDDYGLVNVSLYTNLSGSWVLNQTKNLSGNYDSAVFNITELSDGSFKWNCLVFDNASQSSWGENRSVGVGIGVDVYNNLITEMVENLTYNYTASIAMGYSIYLNESLALGNLTVYFSNGTVYFTKNMSDSSKVEIYSPEWENSMIFHKQEINITPYEVFYGNLSANNEEWLNITIKYYYQNNEYLNSEKVVIEILEWIDEELYM